MSETHEGSKLRQELVGNSISKIHPDTCENNGKHERRKKANLGTDPPADRTTNGCPDNSQQAFHFIIPAFQIRIITLIDFRQSSIGLYLHQCF